LQAGIVHRGLHEATHVARQLGELPTAPQSPFAVEAIQQGQNSIFPVLHLLTRQQLPWVFLGLGKYIVQELHPVHRIESPLTLYTAEKQGKRLGGHVPKVGQAVQDPRVEKLKKSQFDSLLGCHFEKMTQMVPQVLGIVRAAGILFENTSQG